MNESVTPQESPASGWLNREVIGFGLTSLFADMCYESATAVLPAFLKATGLPANELGLALGLMEGLADALSSFVKMGAGWYSDLLPRRKPLVAAGYALTAIATGLMALTVLWPIVLLLRVLAWVGKGARGPARNAMLAASVPPQHKGKAFGLHRAGDTIGAIAGPLLAAWLLSVFAERLTNALDPYRAVLLLTLIPGLASVLVVTLVIREGPRLLMEKRRFTESLSALPPSYRRWLWGVGVFGAGDFSHTLLIAAAVTLLTVELGIEKAATLGAVLYAVRNAAAAIAAFPIGWWSDRVGRLGLLVAAYGLSVITTAAFAMMFVTGWAEFWSLVLLFVAAGVVNAAQESLESAAAADLVPDKSLHGTAFGVLGAVNGVGDFVSSVVVGALWAASPAWGFGYAAAMMALGAVLLMLSGAKR